MKVKSLIKGLSLVSIMLSIPGVGFASQAPATASAIASQYVKLDSSATSSYGYGGYPADYRNEDNPGLFVQSNFCGNNLSCVLLKLDAHPFSNDHSLNVRVSFGEGRCSLWVTHIPFTIENGTLTTPLTSYPVEARGLNDGICGAKPMSLVVTGNAQSGYTMSFT